MHLKKNNNTTVLFPCEILGGDIDLVGSFQGFLLLHPVCFGFDCSKLDYLQVHHMHLLMSSSRDCLLLHFVYSNLREMFSSFFQFIYDEKIVW